MSWPHGGRRENDGPDANDATLGRQFVEKLADKGSRNESAVECLERLLEELKKLRRRDGRSCSKYLK